MKNQRTKEHVRCLQLATMAAIAIWLGICVQTIPAQTRKQAGRRPPAGRAKAAPVSKQAADKPQIVAVVNGESITRQELAQQCLERYGEQVLESLVNKHLILQACRQKGIRITNQDIQSEITTIAGRFNLSPERWLELLGQERNITPEQYRRDIIWPTLALKRLASDKLNVSEAELNNEFEAEYGPKVQTRMIAVGDRSKAEKLLQLANAKPDEFGNLAKKHSEDQNSAAARGLIPHIRKHVGDPKVEEIAFALKPGEISPIVEIANQLLIFKCEKQLPATPISPAYQKVARDKLKAKIVDRNLRDASNQLFQKLQTDAAIQNILNDPALRKKMPGVAATINGQKISVRQLAEECIDRHGTDVLDGEINAKLLRQALRQAGKKVTEADLDAEVGRAAEAYGFLQKDGTPDVERWLGEVTRREAIDVDVYIKDAVWPSVALKKLAAGDVTVTQQDLERGFEANYGERVDVLAIVVGNQRVANEVWNMVRANPNPKFFGELAAQYSIEPVSRANLGEVPPVRQFSGQPKIEQEAFSLTAEDPLSAIVAVADKYIIMYFRGRTVPVVDELSDVRDELEKDLKEKKLRLAMAQRFDDLKEGAQIDNFLKRTSQTGRALTGRPKTQSAQPKSQGTVQKPKQRPRLIRPASQKKRSNP